MDQAKIMEYAKSEGYDGAEYLGRYHDFFCYAPFYDLPVGEAVPPTGLPCLILVDQAGNINLSSPEEAVLYGDGIRKQLEEDFLGASVGGCIMPVLLVGPSIPTGVGIIIWMKILLTLKLS